MDLETVRAKLLADATQFVAELEKAKGALGTPNGNGGLSGAAKGSTRAMSMLRGGMVGLAAQATGTQGPVGKISAALLMMGGGSGLVLGVAAGIGAIAIAFRALTAEARSNAEALKEMNAELEKVGVHGQIRSIQNQIADLERLRDTPTVGERVKRGLLALLGPALGGASFAEQTQRIERAIGKLKTKLGELTGDFGSPLQTAVNNSRIAIREATAAMEHATAPTTELAEAVRRVRLEADPMLREMAPTIAANERLAATQQAAAAATRETFSAFTEAQIRYLNMGEAVDTVEERVARFKMTMAGVPEETANELARLQRETRQMLRGVADLEELRQMGVSAGKQLVIGLAEGMFAMQDFLKSVFSMLLDFALGKLFGTIFGAIGGGSPGGSGTGLTRVGDQIGSGGISNSVVAPATMGLSMNMSGLQPLTAFAVARDPGFQQVIRESVLVAASQGFRGGK